jgi:hypothetical protein
MLELVLYGRPACHLCEEMADDIEQALRGTGYQLRIEDVDTRPDWRERYGLRVPVLTDAAGTEICEIRLDAPALRSLARR